MEIKIQKTRFFFEFKRLVISLSKCNFRLGKKEMQSLKNCVYLWIVRQSGCLFADSLVIFGSSPLVAALVNPRPNAKPPDVGCNP